ncbi:hypothetical protein PPL_06025 [Heterostelium album PN500]|uniref:Uncharacterized protein n=1 Tax=Heterostelium pallidum (strain ATCC 26659 / Pp 5 / PN500) TaxID=670386 RepID=D3BC05_HETP5|nr:hypothetical protein PPL_06025 [Heterostelium album PN500]EFA81188.1 hypothetical protein PPL_06025 [Heterostelium album PN500]|eukprot:XP_020433306.1 hypothetical protein PPL_06025 [Heterostelium album PN500]
MIIVMMKRGSTSYFRSKNNFFNLVVVFGASGVGCGYHCSYVNDEICDEPSFYSLSFYIGYNDSTVVDDDVRTVSIAGGACMETLDREPPIDVYTFPKNNLFYYSVDEYIGKSIDLTYLSVASQRYGLTIQTNVTINIEQTQNYYKVIVDHKDSSFTARLS